MASKEIENGEKSEERKKTHEVTLEDQRKAKSSLERKLAKDVMDQVNKIKHQFQLHEGHKVINPKRIAGESKEQNFENNAAARGSKFALENEGGKTAAKNKLGHQYVSNVLKNNKKKGNTGRSL